MKKNNAEYLYYHFSDIFVTESWRPDFSRFRTKSYPKMPKYFQLFRRSPKFHCPSSSQQRIQLSTGTNFDTSTFLKIQNLDGLEFTFFPIDSCHGLYFFTLQNFVIHRFRWRTFTGPHVQPSSVTPMLRQCVQQLNNTLF